MELDMVFIDRLACWSFHKRCNLGVILGGFGLPFWRRWASFWRLWASCWYLWVTMVDCWGTKAGHCAGGDSQWIPGWGPGF